MKKQILTIGSILSIAVPAVVISCGSSSTQGQTTTEEHKDQIGIQWVTNDQSAGKVQLRYQPQQSFTLTGEHKLSANDITTLSSKIKSLFTESSHDKTGMVLVINNIEKHISFSSEVITEISRALGEVVFTTQAPGTGTGSGTTVNHNQTAADALISYIDTLTKEQKTIAINGLDDQNPNFDGIDTAMEATTMGWPIDLFPSGESLLADRTYNMLIVDENTGVADLDFVCTFGTGTTAVKVTKTFYIKAAI